MPEDPVTPTSIKEFQRVAAEALRAAETDPALRSVCVGRMPKALAIIAWQGARIRELEAGNEDTAPMTAEERMFPVMTQGHALPAWFPWRLVAPHEAQAKRYHSQTLERLAERGGLSPCELLAVLEDRNWSKMDPQKAWRIIWHIAEQAAAAQARAEDFAAGMEEAAQKVAAFAGTEPLDLMKARELQTKLFALAADIRETADNQECLRQALKDALDLIPPDKSSDHLHNFAAETVVRFIKDRMGIQ